MRTIIEKKAYISDIIIAVIFTAAIIFFFFNQNRIIPEINRALNICIKTIIPILFPMTVMSKILIKSDSFKRCASILPISKIYGISKSGTCAIIFGFLFGYPIGANTAIELYHDKCITKEEAEALISVSHNTGPALTVSIIGMSIWKSKELGIILYLMQIISSVIAGILVNKIIFPLKTKVPIINKKNDKKPMFQVFVESVMTSANSMVSICGFIVFFSLISAIIKIIAKSKIVQVILLSFCEITSCSVNSAKLGDILGLISIGFAVGFSGISVLCQVAYIAFPYKLSMKRTLITKITQGFLMAIFLPLFKNTIVVNCSLQISSFNISQKLITILLIIFCIISFFQIKKILKKY